jgi:myxalamid-type polyketide synthase MxaE and MxaD
MTRGAFEAVVRAKLRGAQLLDRLLPELELLVLFSSTGAFLAQPGQAHYAAANAALDAVAQDRALRGRPALSIGWGVWAGTGLVTGEAGEKNVRELARQGIHAFSPERATALLGWLCGSAEPSLAVLPIDWKAFREAKGGRDLPLFRRLSGSLADGSGARGLAGRLAAAGAAERRQLVDGAVRDAVSKVLKVAPARLDPRKTLGAMGLTSLLAMELRNRLEAALGRSLSATLAFNHPTVAALVDHLAGGDAVAPPAPPAPPAPAAVPADLDGIAALSDEEAALALRATRSRGSP